MRDIDELRRGNLARGIGILILPEEFLRLAANSFIGKVETRRGQEFGIEFVFIEKQSQPASLIWEQSRTEQRDASFIASD